MLTLSKGGLGRLAEMTSGKNRGALHSQSFAHRLCESNPSSYPGEVLSVATSSRNGNSSLEC